MELPLLLILLLIAGCSPLDLHARLPWQKDEAEANRPRKIVAFWSDTIMHQQGQAGVRGFGGRVFFYGEDENKPVEVDARSLCTRLTRNAMIQRRRRREEVRIHGPTATRSFQ